MLIGVAVLRRRSRRVGREETLTGPRPGRREPATLTAAGGGRVDGGGRRQKVASAADGNLLRAARDRQLPAPHPLTLARLISRPSTRAVCAYSTQDSVRILIALFKLRLDSLKVRRSTFNEVYKRIFTFWGYSQNMHEGDTQPSSYSLGLKSRGCIRYIHMYHFLC